VRQTFKFVLVTLALLNYIHVLAFTSITQISANDFLGILSSLPYSYWISLFFVISTLIVAYNAEDLFLAKIGLFLLIFIIYGTFIFVEPNARGEVSYYGPNISEQIIEQGHILTDFSIGKSNPYLYFNANPIFTSSLSLILGISVDKIIRYSPIFLITGATFLSYLIFKIIFRNDKRSLILSSTLFPVFFWSEQVYYGPQFFSFVAILFMFYLFLRVYVGQLQSRIMLIVQILFFISIILTHALSPVMIIAFLTVLLLSNNLRILKRNRSTYNLQIFFTISYISFLIYVSTSFFESSFKTLLFLMGDVERFFGALFGPRGTRFGTLNHFVVFNTRLVLVIIIFLGPFIFCMKKFYKQKREKLPDKHFIPLCWFFGAFALIPLLYDMEIIQRIYMFILIASIVFVTLLLKSKPKIAMILLAVLVVLHPIAYTGGDFFRLTPDSELKGAEFFAMTTSKQSIMTRIGHIKSIIPYGYLLVMNLMLIKILSI